MTTKQALARIHENVSGIREEATTTSALTAGPDRDNARMIAALCKEVERLSAVVQRQEIALDSFISIGNIGKVEA